MTTRLLTTREAAALLGIAPESVRRQINRGRLAGTKHGRDYFISHAEVLRYQRQRKVGRPAKAT